jgi:hypothetical protein
MKFTSQDFQRLQWALIFLTLSLLVTGGAVWFTLTLQKQTAQAYATATAADKEIDSKISRARGEEHELREKITRFQMLKNRGIIGAEQRLDWIEAIGRIKAARRISQFDYEFAPQRPVDAAILPGGAAAGGFTIMASQMRLHMRLLHEGDLLNVLDDLRATAPALIQVRGCKIDHSASAQLNADCTLEWITLKESA